MSQLIIRQALEAHLNLMPAMPTAYENADFVPVTGTAYQRVSLLGGSPENIVMGASFYREVGVFNVVLCYPKNAGANDAQTKAIALQSHFKRGTTLVNGGLLTHIIYTPKISPAFIDDGWYCIPVGITYQTDIYI